MQCTQCIVLQCTDNVHNVYTMYTMYTQVTDLSYQGTPVVQYLYLLWSHVLSLTQLEDVLLPVNNREPSVSIHAAYVTSVQPPVSIKSFLSLLLESREMSYFQYKLQ